MAHRALADSVVVTEEALQRLEAGPMQLASFSLEKITAQGGEDLQRQIALAPSKGRRENAEGAVWGYPKHYTANITCTKGHGCPTDRPLSGTLAVTQADVARTRCRRWVLPDKVNGFSH